MQVFRYDRKRNSLVIQSLIMIVIAAIMFFTYSHTSQILYFALFALAIGFLGVYFYRIFVMRVFFSDECVVYKGLSKQYTIKRNEIFDILILRHSPKEVVVVEYTKDLDDQSLNLKCYVIIRANDIPVPDNLSMFKAASVDYISLEYVPEMRVYLDKLLESRLNTTNEF